MSDYVDHSFARRLSVLPLVKTTPGKNEAAEPETDWLGTLVVEWFGAVEAAPGYEDRCRFAADHATAALNNALEYDAIPGIFLWSHLAKVHRRRRSGLRKPLALTAGVLVVVAALLLFLPADFTIHAPAELRPAENQFAFAPGDGVIKKLFVRHGDRVEIGQPLLELRNVDLEVTLADVTGRHQAAREQLAAIETSLYEDGTKLGIAERHRLSGERSRLRQDVVSLAEQWQLLKRKKAELTVVSPLCGEVLTWNVEQQLLHRPVRTGQTLLEIGDVAGAWELELRVPEDDIGHVVTAASDRSPQTVRYRLASEPNRDYQAEVREIRQSAEVRGDEGNVVLLRASLVDKATVPKRAGAAAVAKIHCGRRSLGYVWLHDAIDFLRTKVFFRLG